MERKVSVYPFPFGTRVFMHRNGVIREAEYPIIAVNMDSISLNPTDVEIYEVQIVNNVLKIKGRDKESREVVEFEPNDVFAGHLSYIIDYLPGDENVSGAN